MSEVACPFHKYLSLNPQDLTIDKFWPPLVPTPYKVIPQHQACMKCDGHHDNLREIRGYSVNRNIPGCIIFCLGLACRKRPHVFPRKVAGRPNLLHSSPAIERGFFCLSGFLKTNNNHLSLTPLKIRRFK